MSVKNTEKAENTEKPYVSFQNNFKFSSLESTSHSEKLKIIYFFGMKFHSKKSKKIDFFGVRDIMMREDWR